MADEVTTDHGNPPFTRVWKDGRDVTDEDPSTWGWPYSEYFAAGWRPGMPWSNDYRPRTPRVPKGG